MAQVITFVDYTPTPRFDGNPWTDVEIQEGVAEIGPWVVLETIALSPVDADPENPATRSFTTELASDTLELWYRLVFIDGTGDEEQPTLPVQNLIPSLSYSSVNELARILHIRAPSAEQRRAMERVLVAAAGEINAEIDLAADVDLEAWQLALAAQVNLDRAADLWRHTESIPGVTGLLGDDGQVLPGRYSWERYGQRLAPLKNQWGLA